MPIRIKPIEAIVKKYTQRASAASGDYADGVKNPRRSQSEAAIAAAPAYAAGVQQAIADDRYVKGLREAGDETWSRKSSTVGAQRFPAGVQAGASDFREGVAEFLDTLASLTLPPRLPKGDPGNVARVAAVATALRAKKLSS